MHRIGTTRFPFRMAGGFPVPALALLAGLGLACDGGSGGNVGPGDGGANTGGTGLGPIGGQGGTIMVSDAGIRPVTPNPAATQILPGNARLVGGHISACSNGSEDPVPPATAPARESRQRWCAFFKPGEQLGSSELYVFDATATAERVKANPDFVLNCATEPTLCKRLTTNLWTGQPAVGPTHPFAHRFDGDTLIFHANALSGPSDLYRGPIYAWRPGWDQAARIAPTTGITCSGHVRADVALCLTNIEEDESKPLEYDLLAGRLRTSGNTELPKLDRIHPLHANETSKWRSGFSRDGDLFAYSTGLTDTDKEVLYIMKTDDAATFMATSAQAPVINDASRFQFSRDGTRVFYLDKFNYSDQGNPSGVLMTAPIVDVGGKPAYGPATLVQDKVGAYLILGDYNVDKGVGYFWDVAVGKGTLRLQEDVNQPNQYVTVQTDIASARLSGDGQYTLFSKGFDETTGLADLLIADNTKATQNTPVTACTLQNRQRTDFYGAPFLHSNGLMFFTDEVDTQLNVGTGVAANPVDCVRAENFALKVDFWFPIWDEGLLYSDEMDIDRATIRYREIEGGNTLKPGGGVVLQKDAARVFTFPLPNFDFLIYQINSGEVINDGIYLINLPFPRDDTPAPMEDAGVPPEDALPIDTSIPMEDALLIIDTSAPPEDALQDTL